MASSSMKAVRTVSGNSPSVERVSEKATQSFVAGVPGQLVGGYAQEWDGVTVAAAIAGIIADSGSNLTTSGTAKTLSFGSVPNQASAVNIPRGAPMNDGKVIIEVASPDTVFQGQVGPLQTTSQANIGTNYGMTKDTDNHWFVDTAKIGASAVIKVVALDVDFDTTRTVYFTILPSAAQLTA